MICAPFIYDCEGKEGSLRINHNYPCLACHLQVDQYFTMSFFNQSSLFFEEMRNGGNKTENG